MNKSKKICSKCGKHFMGFPQENICAACRLDAAVYQKNNSAAIAKQREIMNYIRDNQMKNEGQGISTSEIMNNFGVSREFINSMMRKDFFDSVQRQGKKYPHPCAQCGTTIQTGVYCNDCLKTLREMARKIGEANVFKQQTDLEEEAQRKGSDVILIVEESISAAEKIKRIIRKKFDSYTIITAVNMSHTMSFLHGLKVKLVLLDDSIGLRYNGLKILQKIRDDEDVKNVPVIVTSNKFDEQKQIAAISLDAKFYIVKATDTPEDVVECINKVLPITFK